MGVPMDCARVRDEDLAERYLRRELSELEQTEFEQHYFDCEDCYAVVVGAQETLAALPRDVAPPRPRRTKQAWVPAALAAALLMGTLGAWQALRERPPADPSPPPSSSPRGPAALPGDLTAVSPPAFVVVTLRGAGDSAALAKAKPLFERGDYAGAAGLLRPAWGPAAAPAVGFYLGVCELLAGRAVEARAVLGEVAESRDPVYADAARLYGARAALRLGDLPAARADLEMLAASPSSVAAEARTLLARITAFERR